MKSSPLNIPAFLIKGSNCFDGFWGRRARRRSSWMTDTHRIRVAMAVFTEWEPEVKRLQPAM